MTRLMTAPSPTRRAKPVADKPEWVLSAPFRAHVTYLMSTAQVPWPVIAYRAGVSPAILRTLLYGRHGKVRAKIPQQTAAQIIRLRTEDLAWMRISQTSAENAGTRIRLLRSRHLTWAQIAACLTLDEETCQAIARGERTSCSVMVDILAQSACENAWETIGGEPMPT